MDRLEKAMEKARQARGAPNGASAQGYADAMAALHATVDVAEDILDRNRIVAHHPRRPEADIFRILRTQILQAMNKSGFKTLAVTSPRYGDGKTTIALNLALSIALDLKQTVLLVDLDFRKPMIHELLGLPRGAGLTDCLIDEVPIAGCLARLPFERLSVLPAGAPLDNSSEILGSPRMAALARELKTRYPDRLVIYDMPPVLAQDDPIAFLPHVDTALVVVRDGVTREAELKACLDMLDGAPILGTVLNAVAHG
ncbi:MAG: AAA family ATPase [Alphaproteobacteria bacterium]|nr:AAA family ATPase [Alphaproteobacteria bacterium]